MGSMFIVVGPPSRYLLLGILQRQESVFAQALVPKATVKTLHVTVFHGLPLGLKCFQANMSAQWGRYTAGSILVSIPAVVAFIMLSSYLVSGLTVGGVKE